MHRALCASLLTLLVLVTACGADDDARHAAHGRPTVEELAAAIKDPDNSFHEPLAMVGDGVVLDCVAKVLHDSDLSDGALRALVDEDVDFAYNKADDAALDEVTPTMAACVTP